MSDTTNSPAQPTGRRPSVATLLTIFAAALAGGLVAVAVERAFFRPRAAGAAAATPPAAALPPATAPANPDEPAAVAAAAPDPAAIRDEVRRQIAEILARRPSSSRASSFEARVNSVRASTQTLRSQLERYRGQHNDAWPTLKQLADNWSVLLQKTDAQGHVIPASAPGHASALGPYLQSAPVNAFNGKSKVAPRGNPTADAGWVYDETTGRLWPIIPRELMNQVKAAWPGEELHPFPAMILIERTPAGGGR